MYITMQINKIKKQTHKALLSAKVSIAIAKVTKDNNNIDKNTTAFFFILLTYRLNSKNTTSQK